MILQLRSDYSCLYGYGTYEEYLDRCKALGLPIMVVTERNSLSGAYKFLTTNTDIKKCLGIEIGVKYHDLQGYITIYCKNEIGLKELFVLYKKLEDQGKGELCVNFEDLPSSSNLVFVDGLNDSLLQNVYNYSPNTINTYLQEIKNKIGDNYYIGLTPKGVGNGNYRNMLLSLKEKYIVGDSVLYPKAEDRVFQEWLVTIGRHSRISSDYLNEIYKNRHNLPKGINYISDEQEQQSDFNKTYSIALDYNECKQRTKALFDSFSDITFKYRRELRPALYKDEKKAIEVFKQLIEEGFNKKRKGTKYEDASRKEMQYEYDEILANDFVGYFLVVHEFCQWYVNQGYQLGAGRGSAGGSELLYLLGITDTDPLRFNLMFRRFIGAGRGALYEIETTTGETFQYDISEKFIDVDTHERKYTYQLKDQETVTDKDGKTLTIQSTKIVNAGSLPDIDTDFMTDKRELVFQHCVDTYGKEYVCKIGTLTKYQLKLAFKDLCMITGIPVRLSQLSCNLLPEEYTDYQTDIIENEQLINNMNKFKLPYVDAYLWGMSKLLGRIKGVGIHAAGCIISPYRLDEIIPLRQGDSMYVSGFENAECEQLGLVKMDFLGLDTLDIIYDITQLIKKTRGVQIDIKKIINSNLDDPLTLQEFSRGETQGLFQFTADGVRGVLTSVGSVKFDDIVAITALYRPGPLQLHIDTEYATRKNDPSKRLPIDEKFKGTIIEEILKETYNTLIYQEQIMKIAKEMAGFNDREVEHLRKAISKKKKDKIKVLGEAFIKGMLNNGYDKEATEKLWDTIIEFGAYCFNKSHSVSYSLNAYVCGYLKAHFKKEFFSVTLTRRFGTPDKYKSVQEGAYVSKVEIYPPDINKSDYNATPVKDKEAVQLGLKQISGLSGSLVTTLLEHRGDKYIDLVDFIKKNQSKLSKATLLNLVKSGVLYSLGVSIKDIKSNGQDILDEVKSPDADRQMSLFDDVNVNISKYLTKTDKYYDRVRSSYEALKGYFGEYNILEKFKRDRIKVLDYNNISNDGVYVGLINSVKKKFYDGEATMLISLQGIDRERIMRVRQQSTRNNNLWTLLETYSNSTVFPKVCLCTMYVSMRGYIGINNLEELELTDEGKIITDVNKMIADFSPVEVATLVKYIIDNTTKGDIVAKIGEKEISTTQSIISEGISKIKFSRINMLQ